MSSPLNINPLGLLGVGGVLGKPLVEGFKNRKEHGGGIGGIVKGVGEELGFGDKDQALSEINSKLDKLIGEGGEGDVPNPAQDPAMRPQAPFAPATPLNLYPLMTSTTQDPATNGTGSANAVFGDVRPMSVADPNIDTKGSLFNKQQNF
jgi:hypothetical protein